MNDREIERFDLGLPNGAGRYPNKIPVGCTIHGFERDRTMGRTFALIERAPVDNEPLDMEAAKRALRGGVPIDDVQRLLDATESVGRTLRASDDETRTLAAARMPRVEAGAPVKPCPKFKHWIPLDMQACDACAADEARRGPDRFYRERPRAWGWAPEWLRHLGASLRLNKSLVCEFSTGNRDYHDYLDAGPDATPMHFHTYTCERCGKGFGI